MKLSLRIKVMVIPLTLMFLSTFFLIGVSLWVKNHLWQGKVEELSLSQAGLASKSLASVERQSLALAAMAAATPGVQEAYQLAADNRESEGRALLRTSMAAIHASVSSALGIKQFKVHFHLPPAKSFLRIWRAPGKKDGGDDLASFRDTVLKVNQAKKPITGIEIGRGGFAIRGLVPIANASGSHIGSVEALLDFNKIFETARFLETDNVAVYMLAKELEIARKLKEKKLPQTGDVVRVFSSDKEATDSFIMEDLLKKSLKKKTFIEHEGRLITGLPIKDFSGSTKGALVFVRDASEELALISKITWGLMIGGAILLVVVCLFLYLSSSSIVKRLYGVIDQLEGTSNNVARASGEINSSSQSVASGASEQAAALEETSSSMEETSAMIKANADNSLQANNLMTETTQITERAKESMSELISSMGDISKASEETSKIIKTIDEIAFQTNLLALNAAVEAARAGEAGAGFAVVADEVRNLAMRATEAAKNTAGLIEDTISKVKKGEAIAESSNETFNEVAESNSKVNSLVSEISTASTEQAQGVEQIRLTISEMESVTQTNAASAEESAASSEELEMQAQLLEGIVATVNDILTGSQTTSQSLAADRQAPEMAFHPAPLTSHKALAPPPAPKTAPGPAPRPLPKTKAEETIPFDDEEFEDF
ncbi:MAG: methyl-accepting chemotaxis protein [Thermodesulfobacteriota bacterium]